MSKKTAVVTGSTKGIGKGYAKEFLNRGINVVISGRSQQAVDQALADLKDECKGGARVAGTPCEMSDAAQVQALWDFAKKEFGGVDIWVNNAGFALPAAIDSDEYEHSWDSSLDVMATAQAWAIRAALPGLRKSPHPRIINVASTEAHGATRFNSAYVVAKHASVGLTRAMAVDLGKEGITVNCVCPGPVHTGITQGIPDENKETFANRRTALRRYAQPEEVAHATLSLVLPAASFITGATLVVDGGVTIRNA